jgi:hypothetical protein
LLKERNLSLSMLATSITKIIILLTTFLIRESEGPQT